MTRLSEMIRQAEIDTNPKKRASAFKHPVQVRGGRKTVTIWLTDEGLAQYQVAEWMRLHKMSFLHCPNEGRRSPQEGLMLKMMGLEPGAADFLIFSPPRCGFIESYRFKGIALEMKSLTGKVTPIQAAWLESMNKLGWITHAAFGYDEAVRFLAGLGYGRK